MDNNLIVLLTTQRHPLLKQLNNCTSLRLNAARLMGAISLRYVDRISFSPQN
ncbi:MAG: hypothetical protein HOC23_19975 [Halieaceae bacterium]|nr:hypothetical protein [Halieaceae bacterium]